MASLKLLVVDDSAFARRTLRRILEDAGFEVFEANGGVEALDQYNRQKPHAVLLDIVMLEEGGFEVLQRLRSADPRAVVLMATADVQEATRQEALAAGAAGVVNKPFKADEVVAIIHNAISSKSS